MRQTFVLPPIRAICEAVGMTEKEVVEFAKGVWVQQGGDQDVSVVVAENCPPGMGRKHARMRFKTRSRAGGSRSRPLEKSSS